MAANLGTYLGLVGATAILWAGNRYLNNRIKKEVKVYGEEQISVAKERKKSDGGTDRNSDGREQSSESQGNDAGRTRVQNTTSSEFESDELESGTDSETDKPNRIDLSRITPI